MSQVSLKKIIIIDFGSQFTQLIARRVRELGVYSEIVSHKKKVNLKRDDIIGFILSGGPLNVYQTKKVSFDKQILDLGIPILGICFGHQIISKELGGKVKESKHREFGLAQIKQIKNSALTKNFFNKKRNNNVWMSHSDQVTKLPRSFETVASSTNSKFCIIQNKSKHFYGIQFHPEVTHTKNGIRIIRNFLFSICKAKKNWSPKKQKDKIIEEIKLRVGSSKVICALSGGVDSSVVAKVIHKAIGKNLICIFVNTGLLRKNEEKQVIQSFKKRLKMKLIYINAKDIFIKKLKLVKDPEKKRKIIGNLFIKVFEKESKKYKNVSEDDIGFKKQVELFSEILKRGLNPIVVNSEDIRKEPEETLTKLCERLNLRFQKSMLSWPMGGNKQDGVWASHWYESAHKSTGFSGPEDILPNLEGDNAMLAEASLPLYRSLLKFAI